MNQPDGFILSSALDLRGACHEEFVEKAERDESSRWQGHRVKFPFALPDTQTQRS